MIKTLDIPLLLLGNKRPFSFEKPKKGEFENVKPCLN